jgi:3-phenylpropionate/cinnamic acid dioxygenase small subunit
MSQELQDRHDIGQVIIRYATSVDQRDLDRYATCFVEDVEVGGFTGGTFNDRDTYVTWVGKALERYAGTHHQITNQEIEVDGDRGHMRSYVQATHEMADDPDTLLILWAIYDDEMVRTAEGWRISRHTLEPRIKSRLVSTSRP